MKGTLKSNGSDRKEYHAMRIDWEPMKIIAEYEKKDIRNGYWLGTWKKATDVVIEEIDLNVRDYRYWREMFNKIYYFCRFSGLTNKFSENLIRSIRWYRYRARCPHKTWEDRYSPRIVGWVYEIINAEVNDNCIDNIRCARVGDGKQVKKYYRQQEHGCCGSYDVVRRGPDGKRYLIGCNYGH